MSFLNAIVRAALLAVCAVFWVSGCKPVSNAIDAPLPAVEKPARIEPADGTETTPTAGSGSVDTVASGEAQAATEGQTDTEADNSGASNLGQTDTPPADDPAQETVSPAGDGASSADETVSDSVALEEQAAPAPELTIGSVAPAIEISKWVKGEAVDGFEAGKVYVVEFWATWCGPCRIGMPHISDLQEEYRKDVTFIGVTSEDEQTVGSFMGSVQNEETGATWDEVVKYSIALDDNDGTGEAYMRAAQQSGIPTAFVVGKDGHVEWIGHPMKIDGPIAQIVADDWDRQAALAKLEADQMAKQVSRDLSIAARTASQTGDWSEPIGMVDKLIQKNPDAAAFKRLKINVLLLAERFDDVNRLADELAAQLWEESGELNTLSWQLATRVPKEHVDLELAKKIAMRAYELNETDASTLDTVARIHYELGDVTAAVEWQKKAVEAMPGSGALKETLDKYESEVSQ